MNGAQQIRQAMQAYDFRTHIGLAEAIRTPQQPVQIGARGRYFFTDGGFVTPDEAGPARQHVAKQHGVFSAGAAKGDIEWSRYGQQFAAPDQNIAGTYILAADDGAGGKARPIEKITAAHPCRGVLQIARQHRSKYRISVVASASFG